MSLARLSVGPMPFYAIQATTVLVVLILAALFKHTHRYGPSFVVNGLKQTTTVTLHHNDAAYAEALARRFVHEFWNWSYSGHLQAKARAAYFCREDVGQQILIEAREQDHYLQQLLNTCNGDIQEVTVAWAKPEYDHYLLRVRIQVQEWQSFAHTQYPVEGWIEIRDLSNTKDKQFRMEVVRYTFTRLADPQPVDDLPSEDAIDVIFREARERREAERGGSTLLEAPSTPAEKRSAAARPAPRAPTAPTTTSAPTPLTKALIP